MAAEKSKYQLQERVGKNPYIEILRAKAIEGAFAGRQVTVERTLLEQPNYRHFLNAFISRAEIGRRLRHSNIIPVLEVSSLGDTACVVSDFVEGTSLARIIDRCRHRQIQLPVEFCCTLAWKIGQILSFAHGFPLSPNTPVGILHGELSPRHVLIVDSGEILLRGFGVSNGHVGAKLKSGIPNNAPNYLAPEQICGSPQTPATDVFALGALLYEALTTQTPFSGDGVEEVFDLILAGRLSPPTSARRGLPAAFDDLIGRACSPSIEGRGEPPTNEDRSLFRYRNAIEFCDALSETWGNELLDPQAISAEVRGLFGTTGATRRERRYPVILNVLFRSEDASVETQTEDLSLSGAFVRIVSPPPLGAFVGLKIFGFGEEVQTDAEVVWTRPGDGREGCGLRFVRRVPEDQIRRLVGKVKQQLVEAYVRTQADKDGGAGSAGDTPQIRGEANTQTQQLQGQKSPATTRSATGTMPAAEPASEAFSVPSFSEGSARASRESLEKLIRAAASHGASDIHIHVGHPAILRIGGELVASKGPPYTPQKAEEELLSLINAEQREELLAHGQIEFAHDMPDALRARVTYCRQHRGGVDGVFRIIPGAIPSLSELNLPASLAQYATFRYGLVLITGPTGSGKSTTLASLVDVINSQRRDNIITIEDPIEFVHENKKGLVRQRQVRSHTQSFTGALRAALRQDPDIIVVGELRDRETISLAITAAETGHLVLGTLHTRSAQRTVDRLLDIFPAEQAPQVRNMLSESLRAVVSQRLVRALRGARRLPAVEILIVTPAVSNLIREGKTYQIPSVMQMSKERGMKLLDDALAEWVAKKAISQEEARIHASDRSRFQ